MSNFQPFDGYTDKEASEKKLVRDAFKDGDVWFNTGDLMRSQGFGHAAFADRLGDTFRWKGENVATTEVEDAVSQDSNVEEGTVYGVEVHGAGGKAGMAAIQLKDGAEFDGKALATTVYEQLPPTPCRCSSASWESWRRLRRSRARRSTCASRATAPEVDDPIYVLAGRDEGYVEFYDEYPDEVSSGKRPSN